MEEKLNKEDAFKDTYITMGITEEDVMEDEEGNLEFATDVVAGYSRAGAGFSIEIETECLYWVIDIHGAYYSSQETFDYYNKATFVEAYNNCIKDFTTKINKALTSFDALLEFLADLRD